MTTSRPVLTFQIDASPVNGEDGGKAQLCVEVTPVLDGVAFPRLGVFDAVDMLLHGTTTVETDLYTCSCGHAGCAGFHESVQLRADDDSMSWEFPEEPFRAALDVAQFPASVPLTVTFDKSQYQAALTGLETELARIFKKSAIPAFVNPGWSCDHNNTKTFAAMMHAARRYLAQGQARHRACLEAEGELRDYAYCVQLPDGTIFSCGMAQMAWDRVFKLGIQDDKDRIKAVQAVVRPQLLAEREGALLALSADERAEFFHASSLGLPADAWMKAVYSVLPIGDAEALVEKSEGA